MPGHDAALVLSLAVAWLLLAVGINVTGGFYSPVAIVLVTASYLVLAYALFADPTRLIGRLVGTPVQARLRQVVERSGGPLDRILIGVALVATLVTAVGAVVALWPTGGGASSLRDAAGAWSVRAGLGAALVVAVASVLRERPGLRWWAAMFTPLAIAMVVTIVAHTPSDNDVWFTVQGGARTLLQGVDMFTQCWPGNTDRLTDCVYAYLPLTSVLTAPAYWLLGDIRYAFIIAMAIASIAVFAIARGRLGVVLAFLMAASGFLLVQRAWTEPLLMAGLATAVWAALRGVWRWAIAAMVVVFGTKQHMVLLLPLAAVWPALGVRRTALAFGIAAALALPWFIADPVAFFDDTVRFHILLEPRPDSLSLYVFATLAGFGSDLRTIGPIAILVGTLGSIALAIVRLPRTPLGFVLGGAFVLFTFALLNKQTFYNHYCLVLGLILVALALLLGERSGEAEPGSEVGPAGESSPATGVRDAELRAARR